uniref:Putative secreted protein n=1 Tax=Anopheles darlingi TaxID=43151 RepID=A0A2M4DL91_ANODA
MQQTAVGWYAWLLWLAGWLGWLAGWVACAYIDTITFPSSTRRLDFVTGSGSLRGSVRTNSSSKRRNSRDDRASQEIDPCRAGTPRVATCGVTLAKGERA